jgi:anti-anti-sigma factor
MNVVIQEKVVRTVVVAPLEDLTAFSAQSFRQKLDSLWSKGEMDFVIDLSQTPMLDSAGLAVLVSHYKRCRRHNVRIRVVWPKAACAQRILRLTRFDQIFDMLDSNTASALV